MDALGIAVALDGITLGDGAKVLVRGADTDEPDCLLAVPDLGLSARLIHKRKAKAQKRKGQ
jgi:hypothetical protein